MFFAYWCARLSRLQRQITTEWNKSPNDKSKRERKKNISSLHYLNGTKSLSFLKLVSLRTSPTNYSTSVHMWRIHTIWSGQNGQQQLSSTDVDDARLVFFVQAVSFAIVWVNITFRYDKINVSFHLCRKKVSFVLLYRCDHYQNESNEFLGFFCDESLTIVLFY